MARFIPAVDIDRAIDEPADRIVQAVTRAIAVDARGHVPVDTGDLRKTIYALPNFPGIGRVYVGTDHWWPTEYGSRPHVIRSHGDYSLHNAETGEYFGPVVWHPGTPEQPFMRPALYQPRALDRLE